MRPGRWLRAALVRDGCTPFVGCLGCAVEHMMMRDDPEIEYYNSRREVIKTGRSTSCAVCLGETHRALIVYVTLRAHGVRDQAGVTRLVSQ